MSSDLATLPSYPVDALPDCARLIVSDLAEALSCSVSLPATLALGAMSGAVGGMAKLGQAFPRLWAVVKAHDATPYDICKLALLDPLRTLADEIFEKGDIVSVDMWDDHDALINRSPDASVWIPIRGRPYLCPQGIDTMACVGRMDGELWLQPTLWRKILCADCSGDSFGPAFPRSVETAAREKWLQALRGVMIRRKEVAGRPLEFKFSENLMLFFDEGIDTDNALCLALLLALFDPSPNSDIVTDEQASAAMKLIVWHGAAKKRLFQNAMESPWGGAFFGESGAATLPPRAWEIATRLQRREERRAAEFGVSTSAPEGLYLFLPDATGIPCGLEQFRQVHGPSLSPANVRNAINTLEDLAAAANRIQMHYDHGIWGRTCPHGIAAAIKDGRWCAIVVWQLEPSNEKKMKTRVRIKNVWVATKARRHHLATSLVELVGTFTNQSPLFEAPFTDHGKTFADSWYKTKGGAPEGWQFGT
jgi:hypothetical protein